MHISLIDFSEDIKDLYLKTGIKEIEDNYITTFAAAGFDLSDEQIVGWINGLSRNEDVSDPEVVEALKILPSIDANQLVNNFNTWLLENTRLPSSFANPKKGFQYPSDYVRYYLIFNKILGDNLAGLLLRPFSKVLNFFASPQVQAQMEIGNIPDDFTVFHDLMTLQNKFLKSIEPAEETKETGEKEKTGRTPTEEYGGETKVAKLQNLYDDLYDWFSEDFAKAAKNQGYIGLAEEFERGALLGNVEALKDYINKQGLSGDFYVEQPNPIYMNLLEKFMKDILNRSDLNRYLKPENHIELYQIIKEQIMKIAGHATLDQIANVRLERQKTKKIPSRTKEKYYERQEGQVAELNLSDEPWMDGNVMSLLSVVLAELHYRFNL